MNATKDNLQIGWAEADITPDEPVIIAGQFHARLPEAPPEPLTATALTLTNEWAHVVLVSCDLNSISDDLAEAVLERIRAAEAGPDAECVLMSATHTHTGPENRSARIVREEGRGIDLDSLGIDLGVMTPDAYIEFAGQRIAAAIMESWNTRLPGKIAWGMDYAVVGRNRRWVDVKGRSTMYGNTAVPEFSHIEGYEDHSVNILATYAPDGMLTGALVNVPCPAQVSENDFRLSPDYWFETRNMLRKRFGEKLFILPQCSAAGDQSPHPIYEKNAIRRMENLYSKTPREMIAGRLAHAVENVLAVIGKDAKSDVLLRHETYSIDLPLNPLTEQDAREALEAAERYDAEHAAELRRLKDNPSLLNEPRWYMKITSAQRQANRQRNVALRFENMKDSPTRCVTIHGVRLGDIAIASNPFEYYLDYGIRIKARSPFVQTFLAQLAGGGTYVPSRRSVAGGGYGSVPASNPIGFEGGELLCEATLELLDRLHGKSA